MHKNRRVRFADEGRTVIIKHEKKGKVAAVFSFVKFFYKPLLAVCVVLLVVYAVFVRADVIRFYPGSCLGTWENVANAMGKPELETGMDGFNSGNSAHFPGGDAQIFCGNFSGESTPKDKIFKKATLSFSWSFLFNAPQNTTSSFNSSSSADAVASSTTFISPPAFSPPNTPVDSSGTAVPSDPNPSTPSSTSTDTSVPSSSVSSSSPTTWLDYFLPRALADDFMVIASSSDQASSLPAISLDTYTESSTLSIPFNLATPPTSSQSIISNGEENILQINYSFDGKAWMTLGAVNKDNWRDASYEIPVHSWEELSELQINIKGLSVSEPAGDVLFDGMTVEAEYDSPGLIKDLFRPAPPPPPKPQDLIFDKRSKHSCEIVPFSMATKAGGTAVYTVLLHPSKPGLGFVTQLGSFSDGITGTIVSGAASTTVVYGSSTQPFTISVSIAKNFEPASLSLVMIYKETQENGTVLPNFCQYNLIVE